MITAKLIKEGDLFRTDCPSCKHPLKLYKIPTLPIKCPHCGVAFICEYSEEVTIIDSDKPSQNESNQQKYEMKHCPYCDELIHKDAKKCRYCNEFLDQALRKSRDGAGVYEDIKAQMEAENCYKRARDALAAAIIGIFFCGIILEPYALIVASGVNRSLEKMGLPRSANATAAKIIGWIVLILSVVGIIMFVIAKFSDIDRY